MTLNDSGWSSALRISQSSINFGVSGPDLWRERDEKWNGWKTKLRVPKVKLILQIPDLFVKFSLAILLACQGCWWKIRQPSVVPDAIRVFTKKLPREVSHGMFWHLLDMRRNRDGTNRAASQVHVSRPYNSATARTQRLHACTINVQVCVCV